MFEKEINEYLHRTGFDHFSPKAVLFDMDGVLYDSMPGHAYSWHNSMKEYGIDMSESDAYRYEGMRGVETIRLMAREQLGRELTRDEAEIMYAEKSRIFSTRPEAPIMAGIIGLMEKIRSEGKQIVVVTGSGQHSLLEKLCVDFEGFVARERIVSAFDVEHGKPAPDPYMMGLAKVDAQPWEAIVVENAPLGVRAGVAARIFTIAVNTGPLPDSALANEGASLVMPSMPELRDRWSF